MKLDRIRKQIKKKTKISQEFSCQEVRDCSDDMVVFFATNSDMRRFLSILEAMWHTKNVSSIF